MEISEPHPTQKTTVVLPHTPNDCFLAECFTSYFSDKSKAIQTSFPMLATPSSYTDSPDNTPTVFSNLSPVTKYHVSQLIYSLPPAYLILGAHSRSRNMWSSLQNPLLVLSIQALHKEFFQIISNVRLYHHSLKKLHFLKMNYIITGLFPI